MEYIQENERTPKKDEGGINLRDVVELIIANWYWFVLSVLVCVGSAYFYVLTIQPVYQRQAVTYGGLKKIGFTRTKTLGYGGDCCNFHFFKK